MARFEDLDPFDQELLNTDLGEEAEKTAAEQVALSQYMYEQGAALAQQATDAFDKQASDDSVDDINLDEESKVASAELGSFMARGYFDDLVKQGSDEHGDPLHYLMPMLEEKVAAHAAAKAVENFRKIAASRYNAGMINKVDNAKGGKRDEIGNKVKVKSAKGSAKGNRPYKAVGGSMLGGGSVTTRELNSKAR